MRPRNRNDVSQFWQALTIQRDVCASELRDKLSDHCDIVARLESGSGYQHATSHRAQDVLQLAQAIGRIDVDKNQPGLRRRELRDRPFRAVRGPDSDPIARLQAESQKPRGKRIGTGFEFRIGPANLLVRNDQRFARPISCAHFVQKCPDGLSDQGQPIVAMHVTLALHESLLSITKSLVPAFARSAHFPSKTSVGGSMSLLKASPVFAKPR